MKNENVKTTEPTTPETGEGTEGNNIDTPKDDTPLSPTLAQAAKINAEKAALLEREEKLIERKERLHADQLVGGETIAGQSEVKHVETDEEKAARFERGGFDILAK